MILILIGLLSLCLVGHLILGSDVADEGFGFFIGFVSLFFGTLGLIIYVGGAWSYIAAGHKASIINREFNTNYTQQEVYYAADVIETIQQIKRQRIELSGDLLKQGESE